MEKIGSSPRGRTVTMIVCCAVVMLGLFLLARQDIYVIKAAPLPTGLDPNFINQVDECFIPTAAVYGYTLRIVSGFRSMAEQQQIYDEGRLEDGEVVSEAPPGHSLHNYGFAVDIVDRRKGYDLDWPQLIAIGKYCGLGNGGVGDYPHFEYRGGLTTDQFAAGMRPKPLALPCGIMAERAKENQPISLADLQSCGAPDFSKL
jgi:hypothetical protein